MTWQVPNQKVHDRCQPQPPAGRLDAACPNLPDDFDTAYDSSALTYPNASFSPELGAALYNRYLDELEYARHARVRRVAEEVAMLDLMSGGRVDSGFVRGIGWEYFGHSVNPTKSRSRFNEAHDLIIKAWTSPEIFSWCGENYEYRYVNLWPRPRQQPHPPVYIPGAGSTETMMFVAEHGYTYMSVYAPTGIVRRWFDGMRGFGSDYDQFLANGQAVVGSPAAVADRLGQLYDELGGFGQIIALFAIGPSTTEQVKRSAELFATEVMPVLRPLGIAKEAAR